MAGIQKISRQDRKDKNQEPDDLLIFSDLAILALFVIYVASSRRRESLPPLETPEALLRNVFALRIEHVVHIVIDNALQQNLRAGCAAQRPLLFV